MERKIVALEMVEADDRAAYIPADDGGYELHPDIVAMLDDMNSRRAELDAKLEAERALRVDLVTKRDLRGRWPMRTWPRNFTRRYWRTCAKA